MSYTPFYTITDWQNLPNKQTPINRDNLLHIENAIKELDNRVVQLDANNSQLIKITLAASGWSGSAAPYKQTVRNAEIKADRNYILASDADGLSLAEWQSYQKAWSIIATGSAITASGSATFSAYNKPTSDCSVYLVEV